MLSQKEFYLQEKTSDILKVTQVPESKTVYVGSFHVKSAIECVFIF